MLVRGVKCASHRLQSLTLGYFLMSDPRSHLRAPARGPSRLWSYCLLATVRSHL